MTKLEAIKRWFYAIYARASRITSPINIKNWKNILIRITKKEKILPQELSRFPTHELLIPISTFLLLIPINPIYSNAVASSWTTITLIFVQKKMRWLYWPLAMISLMMTRNWWLNEPASIVSSQDIILIFLSMMATIELDKGKLKCILIATLIILPFASLKYVLAANNPPIAGENPLAFILGLITLVAYAAYFNASNNVQKFLVGCTILLAFISILETGSRAALLSSILSISFIFLCDQGRRENIWRNILILISASLTGLAFKQLLSPSSLGMPGINKLSDIGRFLIGKCYISLPFSGNNRFLYGIGFEQQENFCRQVNGHTITHAHNLYIHIWANTGLLGILGLTLFITMIISVWQESGNNLEPFFRMIGHGALVYILLQSCFDISMLHYPISLILTGIMIAIPIKRSSQ